MERTEVKPVARNPKSPPTPADCAHFSFLKIFSQFLTNVKCGKKNNFGLRVNEKPKSPPTPADCVHFSFLKIFSQFLTNAKCGKKIILAKELMKNPNHHQHLQIAPISHFLQNFRNFKIWQIQNSTNH